MIDHLNETVWATLRPSPIHGIGVFAIRDIPKGTRITDHSVGERNQGLIRVSPEDFDKILPEIRQLILDRTMFREGLPLIFPSPNAEQTLRSYMNHSKTPNSDGENALVDIKAGEEITEDYTSFYELHPLTKDHYQCLK